MHSNIHKFCFGKVVSFGTMISNLIYAQKKCDWSKLSDMGNLFQVNYDSDVDESKDVCSSQNDQKTDEDVTYPENVVSTPDKNKLIAQ